MPRLFNLALLVFFFGSSAATAGPSVVVGDLALRHDIQRLADFGVIRGTSSTWPLAWGPILSDIRNYESDQELPPDVRDAMHRLLSRGDWETQTDALRYHVRLSAAENPAITRSYQDVPRDEGEISAGLSWTGEYFSMRLTGTAVSNPFDREDFRLDGSQIALALGNTTFAISTMDRWWGPAWDSALPLSGNARPLPAFTIDRRYTQPFKSKWLSWLGPWDASFIWGQFEKERAVPNAQFLGFRFDFRPIPSLEIGISRSAQWCGDGRPCDLETFWNLLIGKDNSGDGGVTPENEPGNQTAAIDFRWSATGLGLPIALYAQFMAEDEAGGFPSRYMGQAGIDGSAHVFERWSLRWYAEAAATSCDFWKSDEIFNCAYNHGIYQTGYRYRGRSLGHSVDNDARVVTLGFILVDTGENSWQGYFRTGRLNRGGPQDSANSLTPLPGDISNFELIYNRVIPWGRLEIGVGYDEFGGNSVIPSSNDGRAFIQWRSDY